MMETRGLPSSRCHSCGSIGTGKDARINKDDPNRDATPVLAGTDINDISTWTVHTLGDSHASFHSEYWKWTLGGETVFMPTFNKNKDSLAADINGTFAGPDGDRQRTMTAMGIM